MHYYQFNIGDYHSHTNHLEPLEDLAYRRMIDIYYLNEIPLPKNVDEIARLIRMRTHIDCIAVVLRDFFELTKNGYIQTRIDTELIAFRIKSEKARKSAKARWDKTPSKTKTLDDANALRTECEGNAIQEPLHKKQETITNKVKTLDQNEFDPEYFNWFWHSGIRKVNKKKAKLLFSKVLKNLSGETAHEFTRKIIEDIHYKIKSQQMGFSEMHPTTYLNGERWDDTRITSNGAHQQPAQRKQSLSERAEEHARIIHGRCSAEEASQRPVGKDDAIV